MKHPVATTAVGDPASWWRRIAAVVILVQAAAAEELTDQRLLLTRCRLFRQDRVPVAPIPVVLDIEARGTSIDNSFEGEGKTIAGNAHFKNVRNRMTIEEFASRIKNPSLAYFIKQEVRDILVIRTDNKYDYVDDSRLDSLIKEKKFLNLNVTQNG